MALPIVDDDAPLARKRGPLPRYALRVSVLEQCQLNCRYCLPGAVVAPTEKARWLTARDYGVLAPLFVDRGVAKVRFTGGEPTLRPDLVEIVRAFASARTSTMPVDLALTTNGQRVASLLPTLREAGLSSLTVHLDTLRADRMEALMGGGSVDVALDAIDAGTALGMRAKLNAVVQRGRNDDELEVLLDEGTRRGAEVRFIELMNTGSARGYVAEAFMAGRDIVERIARSRGAHAIPRRHASDPAALFRTDDGVTFGVIASDTEPFCDACDRLRLTADGHLRGCLYQHGGIPVGAALHAGAPVDALAALVDAAMHDKRSFHPDAQHARVPFSMADVGG